MSLGEIIVIAVIAILICKPEDITLIIKEFYKLKNYFSEIKQEVTKPFIDTIEKIKLEDENLNQNETVDEINMYLQKITSLNESYQGEYSLKAIKQYYYQLIKNKNE
jgi:Sec-independent protein translocase protein TatA